MDKRYLIVMFCLGTFISNFNGLSGQDSSSTPPSKIAPLLGSMKISVIGFGGTKVFDLKLVEGLPPSLTALIRSDDDRGDWSLPSMSQIGVYNDDDNKISILTKYVPGLNNLLYPKIMYATWIIGQYFYTLTRTQDSDIYADAKINGANFKVAKEPIADSTNNCHLTNKSNRDSRKKRQAPILSTNSKNNTIELLVVADWSIHQKYLHLCKILNSGDECSSNAYDLIKDYIYLIINLVNYPFANMNRVISINVKLANIIIEKSPLKSSSLEEYIIDSNTTAKDAINGSKVLQNFGNYITNLYNNNSNFDHAVLLTNNEIFHESNITSTYTGYTRFGGMCKLSNISADKTQSISLVRDRGIFATAVSLAHQIAHNLKAEHDEEEQIECSKILQYVMSSEILDYNPWYASNLLSFSPCSIVSIANFILNNWQNDGNCLQKNSTSIEPNNSYSEDEQCQFAYGPQSVFCNGDHQDICIRLECWEPSRGVCVVSDEVRALDNTACAVDKTCQNSVCRYISNNSVPVDNYPCRYSNYIGTFNTVFQENFTCAKLQLLSKSTSQLYCNDSVIQLRCCSTCKNYPVTSKVTTSKATTTTTTKILTITATITTISTTASTNFFSTTTTRASSINIMTTSSQPICVVRNADVVFVLDESGSICDSDPSYEYGRDRSCNQFRALTNFVAGLVSNMTVGNSDTRVGFVSFSTGADVNWMLDRYMNKSSLLNAINNVKFVGGDTYTSGGMRLACTQVFSRSGDRPAYPNVLILITDGQPTIGVYELPGVISQCCQSNVKIFILGVSKYVNETILKTLTCPPPIKYSNYFIAPNYAELNTFKDPILVATGLACKEKVCRPKVTRLPDNGLGRHLEANVDASSAAVCEAACIRDPLCDGFEFRPDSIVRCYLFFQKSAKSIAADYYSVDRTQIIC